MQKLHRILVVDDEPDVEPLVLQRMRREIRRGEYEFLFAGNGVEALDKLGEDREIDIVLSDINMPEMDGLTLLQQIPAVDPNIRSVIVSAYGDMKNIRAAMNRGAFDFVTKPIDFNDLRITIERTIKHLELWREALASRDKLVSIQNELVLANRMQQSILPDVFPSGEKFQIYGSMEPARDVGGDFFDIIRLDHGRFGLAIADVSDKGVPAALFMMSSRTLLKGAAIGTAEPKKVLAEVNSLLDEDNEAGMFVTLIYAVFDSETGNISFANGGHNPPMLIRSDGSTEFLQMPDGIALGMVDSFDFEDKHIRLAEGDVLVFYTDGVTEAMNSDNELYGTERLARIFDDASPDGDVEAIINRIFESVHHFSSGISQSDDITCLAIRYGRTP
ncbi:MAG: SpoIIE family protein phosphatase [Albidovulum sp.]|nr:SpoIIE family protein phosphatase [Albidovulum sp.]